MQDGIKPFTRGKISFYLQQLTPQIDQLTHIDRRRMQDFLQDYRRELDPEHSYHRMEQGKDWSSVLGSWHNFKRAFKRYLI